MPKAPSTAARFRLDSSTLTPRSSRLALRAKAPRRCAARPARSSFCAPESRATPVNGDEQCAYFDLLRSAFQWVRSLIATGPDVSRCIRAVLADSIGVPAHSTKLGLLVEAASGIVAAHEASRLAVDLPDGRSVHPIGGRDGMGACDSRRHIPPASRWRPCTARRSCTFSSPGSPRSSCPTGSSRPRITLASGR